MADYLYKELIPEEHIPELVEVFGENWDDSMAQTKQQYAVSQHRAEIVAYRRQRVAEYRRRKQLEQLGEPTADDFVTTDPDA